MSLNLTPKTVPGDAVSQAEHGDFRARLRARRQALAKNSTRLFVLPGYDADNPQMDGAQLVVRYRRLSLERLLELLPPGGVEDVVAADVQFLIDACDEILYRDEDGLHPLVEGHKTTYVLDLDSGQSFGSIVGVDDLPSIREQMIAGFGDNELALTEHSGAVHRWMIDANADDGDAALGEA